MKNLTSRERKIALAAIYLRRVHIKDRFIPDYYLADPSFKLGMDTMRDIRDIVQDHPLNKEENNDAS